jgi:hypothetical protein
MRWHKLLVTEQHNLMRWKIMMGFVAPSFRPKAPKKERTDQRERERKREGERERGKRKTGGGLRRRGIGRWLIVGERRMR